MTRCGASDPAPGFPLIHTSVGIDGRGKETSMQRMPILSETDMSLFELKTRYTRNYLTFAGKNSKDLVHQEYNVANLQGDLLK